MVPVRVACGLKRAELEWADLAGRVEPATTLWKWAWVRFPDLVHEQLPGIDETHEVRVILKDGAAYAGYPDNRKSTAGRLVLSSIEGERGPWPIDAIASVLRITEK